MVDTSPSRSVDTLSFEEALAELETIVKKLEAGQGRLEEAVSDYDRGAKLRQRCESLLADAEQKVQAIVEGAAGPTLRDAG
jgi:exodeoxyribonuclease VII small subunit